MIEPHTTMSASFQSLHIIRPILQALNEEGYTHPTPIQVSAIPVVLSKRDLLASAQTGTGKTAAFAIPILQLLENDANISRKERHIKCLILTPTRELAIQIGDSFAAYGRHLRLRATVIYGGVSQGKQTAVLRKGVDILIATPGRLLDLMNQGFIDLRSLKIFVLDEADRMLDMGFINDIHKILHEVPKKRQTLFFSATLPAPIVKLADGMLNEPKFIEVAPVEATAERIVQSLYYVEKMKKQELLIHILKDESITSVLIFTRTKHGADVLARVLGRHGITAESIHANKAQNTRQRALNNFKQGVTRALVATDIAARGIDVDNLEYVINYEIPNVPETYVHRIGRTGRAGARGVALAFCDPSEKSYIRDIEKLMGKKIHVMLEHPFASKSTHAPQDARTVSPNIKSESKTIIRSTIHHTKKEKTHESSPRRVLSPGEREWKSSKRQERRHRERPFDKNRTKKTSESRDKRGFDARENTNDTTLRREEHRFKKRTIEEPRHREESKKQFERTSKPFVKKEKRNKPNPYSGIPKGKGLRKRRRR